MSEETNTVVASERTDDNTDAESTKEDITVFGNQITFADYCSLPCTAVFSKTLLQATLIPLHDIPTTIDEFKPVNHMIEDGLDIDNNGDNIQSILLPIDALTNELVSAMIVEDNLDGYINGWHPLTTPEFCTETGLDHILHILCEELSVLISFHKRGYILEIWNQEQFYYHIPNKAFRFVCTPKSPVKQTNISEEIINETEKTFVAHLLFVLIGVYPNINGVNYCPTAASSQMDDEENTIILITEDNVVASSTEVSERWMMLPILLRKTIIQSFQNCIGLEKWLLLLSELEAESQVCIGCSRKSFKGTNNCIFCGHSMGLEHLSVQLQVEDAIQKIKFLLTFGRGSLIYGCTLSPVLPAKPFMQIMYNPSQDSLYLKNLSDMTWRVNNGNMDGLVEKNMSIPISSDLTIQLEKPKSLNIRFEKYVEYMI